MSLKSRLLAAFAVLSLVAVACATGQQKAPTQAGGSSTVEELPEEGAPASAPAAPAPAAQAQTVGGPEKGFTVKMPGAPQSTSNKITIPSGDILIETLSSEVDGVTYSLLTYDYPVKFVAARSPEALLNSDGRDALINQVKGTLKSEEPIVLDGYPGKAFIMGSDRGDVRVRTYLVGPRLYTLLGVYNPGIPSPSVDEYLQSLTLINPPPKVERATRATGASDGGTPGPTDAGVPANDGGR
ncbi:hypothetical protein POL68_31590 [Stigmatella sp. ncwal1]|uniref:Lipoprotein n=1 Tax=Stigmatella ashevillensis TaxID=2995309 RepID=A0ABT5DHF9_9BACT|nr:hypothetical protein [Stigmatella ashevillena]MDC0713048.1 hypothetical protein [Stigmatella ashevillena]